MKKIAAINLTVLVLFSVLAGCNINTPPIEETKPVEVVPTEALNDTSESAAAETATVMEMVVDSALLFEEHLGNYLDISHYKTDDQGLMFLKGEYKTTEYDYFPGDGYIVIDGNMKVTTEKTILNDLLLQGWKLDFELTDEHKLGAHMTANTYNLERDGHEISVGLLNDTDEAVHLKDTKISFLILKQYGSSDNFENRVASAPDFLIDEKIDASANIQTILNACGEPISISFTVKDRYAYVDISYGNLRFKMSVDGSTLYEVSWY